MILVRHVPLVIVMFMQPHASSFEADTTSVPCLFGSVVFLDHRGWIDGPSVELIRHYTIFGLVLIPEMTSNDRPTAICNGDEIIVGLAAGAINFVSTTYSFVSTTLRSAPKKTDLSLIYRRGE